MGVAGPGGEQGAHGRGSEQLGQLARLQQRGGHPDGGELDAAAGAAGGVEDVRGLEAGEGDGQVGLDVGFVGEARRHVHRDHAGRGGVDARDILGPDALERAGQPGAEEGVHHHLGPTQIQVVQRLDLQVRRKRRAGRRGVAAVGFGGEDAHLTAPEPQPAGCDQAVAAVVALTGDDRVTAGFGPGGERRLGYGAPRSLHEQEAGVAQFQRARVGGAHGLGGEETHVRLPSLRA